MRYLCSILTMVVSFPLVGQQLKRVVTTYRKSDNVKEVYYVLASDKTVRHGDYYFFFKGKLTRKELKKNGLRTDGLLFKEKGHYKNNLRDGAWIVYKEPFSNVILEERQYSSDKKTGIWKKYIEQEKVITQFDFDANVPLETLVNVGWRYPAEARRKGVEGPVKIRIFYENCEPVRFEILEDIGSGCANGVIESIKEKRRLEKKYGIKSTKCDIEDEIVAVQFRLNQ